MDASTPIPSGVELLVDDSDLGARIAYIRHIERAPVSLMPELHRLVAEESRRELTRIGVIR